MQRLSVLLQAEALPTPQAECGVFLYPFSCVSLATLAFSLSLVVPRELCVLFGFPL